MRCVENNPDHFHNVGIVMLRRIAKAHEVSFGDLLSTVPVRQMSGPVQDDASTRRLEEVARIQNWAAADFLDIRDDLRKELAARGGARDVTAEEIHRRHEALERKRLSHSPSLL